MSTKRKYVQLSALTDKVICDLCHELFTAQGIRSHATHCARRQEKIRKREAFADVVDKVVEAQRKGELALSISNAYCTNNHHISDKQYQECRKEKRRLRKAHSKAASGSTEPHDDCLDFDPDIFTAKSTDLAATAQEEQPDLDPDTIAATPTDFTADAAMSISGDSRQRKCCLHITYYLSVPFV